MKTLRVVLGATAAASIVLLAVATRAAIPERGVYYACVNRADGTVRLIDPIVTRTCRRAELGPLQWVDAVTTSAEAAARAQGDVNALAAAKAYADDTVGPICRGRPGGTCSVTSQACAYDKDCPGYVPGYPRSGERCVWTRPFPRFADNGDGTVTDRRTCLMWEKKTGTLEDPGSCPDPSTSRCQDPHNVNNLYQWTALGDNWALQNFDGNAATDFLKKLNDAAFAGHTDWRLPTTASRDPILLASDPELESLRPDNSECPAHPELCIVDPVLLPVSWWPYWTSNTAADTIYRAVSVVFHVDSTDPAGMRFEGKGMHNAVRAVRGGPGVP